MKRLLYLLIIVIVVVAPALPTGAEVRNQLPPPPDPGPGGSGGFTCVTNCTECRTSCSTNNNCVQFCANTSGDGGCGCTFSGDHAEICNDEGTCTYQ